MPIPNKPAEYSARKEPKNITAVHDLSLENFFYPVNGELKAMLTARLALTAKTFLATSFEYDRTFYLNDDNITYSPINDNDMLFMPTYTLEETLQNFDTTDYNLYIRWGTNPDHNLSPSPEGTVSTSNEYFNVPWSFLTSEFKSLWCSGIQEVTQTTAPTVILYSNPSGTTPRQSKGPVTLLDAAHLAFDGMWYGSPLNSQTQQGTNYYLVDFLTYKNIRYIPSDIARIMTQFRLREYRFYKTQPLKEVRPYPSISEADPKTITDLSEFATKQTLEIIISKVDPTTTDGRKHLVSTADDLNLQSYYLKLWKPSVLSDFFNCSNFSFTNDLNTAIYGEVTSGGSGNNQSGIHEEIGVGDNSTDSVPFLTNTNSPLFNSKFIRSYVLGEDELSNFANKLWQSEFASGIFKVWASPMDAIINLLYIPLSPNVTGFSSIRVGNYTIPNSAASVVSDQFITFDCGYVFVPAYFSSFMDFAPYTKVSIYLPYCGGFHDLSVNDVMSANIHLIYKVDILTGNCTATLFIENDVNLREISAPLYTFSGNCAVQYPLSATDNSRAVSGFVSNAMATVANLATGNILGAAGSGINAVISGSINDNIMKNGNVSGTVGAISPQYPYVLIQRPVTNIPYNFEYYRGHKANYTTYIGNLSGYASFSEVHLDYVNALDDEKEEINSLLTTGVYL